MRRRSTIATAAATVAAVLALPAGAGAHVTLHPDSVSAGAETELVVRVPNERDNASTTKVAVQLPHGFVGAQFSHEPDWTVKVVKAKLTRPIQTDDGPISEEVRQIVWTANATGAIPPGAFKDFPIAVLIPDRPGTLTFKALQTYSNGEVVRWIGPPDAEEPAPTVTVTAATGNDATSTTTTTAAAAASKDDGGDGVSKGLGIAALILGALGLLAGGLALARSGRRSPTTGS
jgi:uncharacterized protein YcnI